jgi:hypothetical protein
MTPPMAAVVAGLEPDIAAKIVDARIDTMAKPPVIRPTTRLAKFTNRFEIPPWVIRFPARIKKGIAISGKESMPENIVWALIMSGTVLPNARVIRTDNPRQIAIGTPIIRSIKKLMKRAAVIFSLPWCQT